MADHTISVNLVANTTGFTNSVTKATKTAKIQLSDVAYAAKQRLMYAGINAAIYGTIDAIKDMINNVIELDKAQTELKKVSNLTGQSLDNFTNKAFKMGEKVAKTGTEIVQASTEFVKMGNQPKLALQLSEYATRLQNIADTEISAGDAAKFINSQLKAFGNTKAFADLASKAEQAEYAIDAVNNVANQFGVGTNDLQAALTKIGAAMSTTGNSFAESIGIVTAGTEVMPGQASKVGRGLRTIALTLSKARQETDKLATSNKAVNISFRKEDGSVKNLYEVMKELYEGNKAGSKAWKDLGQEERESIGYALAGKTQYEVFSSVMENFSNAIDAATEAEYKNAHGSSRRENERYLDSIQGKIADFKSAWKSLSYHVISSDFLKDLISAGTNLLKILDSLTVKIGALPTLLALIGTTIAAIKIPKTFLTLLTGKITTSLGLSATTSGAGVIAGTVATGATEAAEASAGLTLGQSIKNAIQNRKYKGTPTEILKKNSADVTEAEKQVIINSTKLKRAKEAEALAQRNLTTAYSESYDALYTTQTLKEKGRKLDLKGMSDGEKIRHLQGNANKATLTANKNLVMSQSKVAAAQAELNTATLATAEAQKTLAVSEAEAVISANALLPVLQALGATLVLVGIAVGLKKWGDYISFEGRTKQLKSLNKELKTNKKRIEELEEKGENRTQEEDRELQLLKLETEQLEEQIKLKKEQLGLAYKREAKTKLTKGTKAQESSKNYDTLMASRNMKLRKLQAQYDAATTKDEKKQIEKQIQDISALKVKEVKEIQDAYDDIAILNWKDLTTKEEKQYFKDTIEGYLSVAESVEGYRDALGRLPKKQEIEISAVDKNGNLKTIEISAGKLSKMSDEEIQLIMDLQSGNVNWDEMQEILDNNSDAYSQAFKDVIIQFMPKGEKTVEKKEEELAKARDVQFQAKLTGRQAVDDEIRDLIKDRIVKIWVKLKNFAKARSKAQGLAAESRTTEQEATGKRKGEHGGLAWLGDEGSAQHPMPELVVNDKGAYLAGTQGWELHNLKSSDTVYTATQTKKLLSKNSFQGSPDELPRYYKGKLNLKSAKAVKNAKKSKVQTWTDNAVSRMDYLKELNDWTEQDYIKAYKDIFNRYGKKMSTSQKHDYYLATHQYKLDYERGGTATEKAKKAIDAGINAVASTGSITNVLSKIEKAKKAGQLTLEEYNDYIKETYKNALEYTQKEYEAGKTSWEKLLKSAKAYWKQVGKDSKEYYETLEGLRDTAVSGDEARLSFATEYATYQRDALQRLKDEEKETEDLADAKNTLAEAESNLVKVYRDGKWVYEKNAEAIKDAQSALSDTEGSSELDEQIQQWEDILDILSLIESQADLVNSAYKAGALSDNTSFAEFIKSLGTDKNLWSNMAQTLYGNMSDLAIADDSILEQLLEDLGNMFTSTNLSNGLISSTYAQTFGSLFGGSSLFGSSYSGAEIVSTGNITQTFNFDKIVLPNVKDADSFVKNLQLLPNQAIQQAALR